jgi:hypothetical protein
MRSLLLPSLLAVLLLAGCGGAASVGSTLGEAAEVAPSSARAFVVVRTDGDADQTRAAVDLLERFPAVREHELELADDVLPALGDEAAIVMLPGDVTVVLARPNDREKLDALLARTDKDAVTREIAGWTAIGKDEAALDAFEREREGGVLADDESFSEEFDALPGDSLAKAWSAEREQQEFPAITAAVFADEEGLRFEGTTRGGPNADAAAEPYEPRLLERVPAGASLVASFRGRDGLAAQMRTLPIPPGLGLDALGDLLEGEGVLYLRPAMLIPEVTLLTEVEDEDAALVSLRSLFSRFGAPGRADGRGSSGRLELGPVALTYGVRDGVLAVTTATLDVLEPAEDAITDDARFTAAADRAGLPDESGGFLYLRIDDLLPLLTMLGGMQGGGLPPETGANLEPLRTLFVHAGRDGERNTFAGTLDLSR